MNYFWGFMLKKFFSVMVVFGSFQAYALDVSGIDPENKYFIEEINKAGSEVLARARAKDPGIFSKNWEKVVADTHTYAQKKNPAAYTEFSATIAQSQKKIAEARDQGSRASQVFARSEIQTKRDIAKKQIKKIKDSRFTAKERRWAIERYLALLDILFKIPFPLEKPR